MYVCNYTSSMQQTHLFFPLNVHSICVCVFVCVCICMNRLYRNMQLLLVCALVTSCCSSHHCAQSLNSSSRSQIRPGGHLERLRTQSWRRGVFDLSYTICAAEGGGGSGIRAGISADTQEVSISLNPSKRYSAKWRQWNRSRGDMRGKSGIREQGEEGEGKQKRQSVNETEILNPH